VSEKAEEERKMKAMKRIYYTARINSIPPRTNP
jgi:hypothetical protein